MNFRLHRGYLLTKTEYPKIGPQFAGIFKITERIGRLAYRLNFPNYTQIHDVISLAHFEPATDFRNDLHRRYRIFPPAVIVDDQKKSEIEKFIQKRRIRRKKRWSIQYLARWLKYGPEWDQWIFEHRLSNAKNLINDYELLCGQTVRVQQKGTVPPMSPIIFPHPFPSLPQEPAYFCNVPMLH